MIALLQRVSAASVHVDNQKVAAIATGLLVFVGIEREDDEAKAERLAERVVTYRVFSDDDGKMNLSVHDAGGALLLVPQFTLAADTRSGTRASFSSAAEPEQAARMFDYFSSLVRARRGTVECGQFGADMRVSLVNEGPVTFWLSV